VVADRDGDRLADGDPDVGEDGAKLGVEHVRDECADWANLLGDRRVSVGVQQCRQRREFRLDRADRAVGSTSLSTSSASR
jgi:hypothetical protein